MFLIKNLESIGISMLYSEIAGLIVAFTFLIALFPIELIWKILRMTVLSFIPSLFAIYSIYAIIFRNTNMYLLIFIYFILFALNLFFNGKSLIINYFKNKDI